jgi:glycosyltransferase involved in cell wall biosynthesis
MRVLFVTKDMGAGGAERFVANVLPELVRLGVDVRLAMVMDDEALAGPVREAGIPIIKLGHPLAGLYAPRNIKESIRKLRGIIDEFRPDILHSQIYLSDLVTYLAADGNTRILTTIQNTYPWWRWWRVRGKRFRYWAMTKVESHLFRTRNARFAPVSDAVSADALRFLKIRPQRTRTMYNCIRPGDYPPKGSYERSGGPAIIQVANLHPSKGHDTSLRAFADVLKEYPDARLLMAGEGLERPRLEAMIRELGLAGKAELLGRRSDVKELLGSADLYWMPSLYEGLSLASLEAMATGLPIVASDASGLNETVVGGETGYLIGIGDHAALARRTLEILGDTQLARGMGEAGRKRVEEHFSVSEVAKKYTTGYSDFIEGIW